MTTTSIGPQGPNYTITRPANDPAASGGVATWAKDCSVPGAKDGTYLTAGFFNIIIAQLRVAIVDAGITLDDSDDMLYRAMVAIAVAHASSGYTLPTATPTVLGGVKIDNSTITISGGVISSTATGSAYTLPKATASALGGIEVGAGLSIDPTTGVLSVTSVGSGSSYTLPAATFSALGGVIAGSGLSVSGSGVLSVNHQFVLLGGDAMSGNLTVPNVVLSNAGGCYFQSSGGVIIGEINAGIGALALYGFDSGGGSGKQFMVFDYPSGNSIVNYSLSVGGDVSSGGQMIANGTISSNVGYKSKQGTGGGYSGNIFNIYWNGTAPVLYIDNVYEGKMLTDANTQSASTTSVWSGHGISTAPTTMQLLGIDPTTGLVVRITLADIGAALAGSTGGLTGGVTS